MSTNETPLIVRVIRKRDHHGGHHGGAWKVAYADFVTAMMALFIVLWIVGQSEKVKNSVAGYFSDPRGFMLDYQGRGPMDREGNPPAPPPAEGEQERLKDMGRVIMQSLQEQPELKGLADQVQMDIVDEGLRIELQERSESVFFDVGTSNMNAEAREVLRVIAAEIGTLPNRLIVEGHTDSRPYSRADGYTNFELSTDRANMARRILVQNGVRENQIEEVRGYADSRLRDPKDPMNVINRRISIIIKFAHSPTP
jgi:chemotaxis protein MotB